MSPLQGQSLLTWSPSQVLLASSPASWTPYLVTMVTNPTAKYSLDLQISCARSDSTRDNDDDTTARSPKELEDTISPFPNDLEDPEKSADPSEDTTTSPSDFKAPRSSQEAANLLPDRPLEMGTSHSMAQRDVIVHSSQSKRSSTSSSLTSNQPRRAKRALQRASMPATTPNTGSAASINSPTHRHSNPSIDAASQHSRPSLSRRSNTLPTRRTGSRSNSFLQARHPAPEIDFQAIIQRTRAQQQAISRAASFTQSPDEAESPPPAPPPPQNEHDHPIDWTDPASRAAQYAAIDAKRKGLRGAFSRLKRKLKLGKREIRFYEGGSDAGSVRRYRMREQEGREWAREIAALAREGG